MQRIRNFDSNTIKTACMLADNKVAKASAAVQVCDATMLTEALLPATKYPTAVAVDC
jgi:hypothetical protein